MSTKQQLTNQQKNNEKIIFVPSNFSDELLLAKFCGLQFTLKAIKRFSTTILT